ncbi:MAG: RnfABCDGE type electron transport complex subunit B [Ruminococcus sp.]|nr:RnfABCDGE type electron transport complex subunit B [Ruminococcus sp.]
MFNIYILPVIAFASMGLIAGVLLTAASKIFEVKTDERIEQINSVLPQANCGACGCAGCEDYAKGIVNKNLPTNLCKPGGNKTASAIASIMNTASSEVVSEIAVINCCGDCNATASKYDFVGIETCLAVKRFYSGNGLCSYGCIGYGDCAQVCSENAITLSDGIAHINRKLCIGCGQCATVCPNSLISMIPESAKTIVRCSSKDNGKTTKLNCKNGCIGCKICEKNCESQAITVTDFHASIDYSKCTNCGVCAEKCPVKVIEYPVK